MKFSSSFSRNVAQPSIFSVFHRSTVSQNLRMDSYRTHKGLGNGVTYGTDCVPTLGDLSSCDWRLCLPLFPLFKFPFFCSVSLLPVPSFPDLIFLRTSVLRYTFTFRETWIYFLDLANRESGRDTKFEFRYINPHSCQRRNTLCSIFCHVRSIMWQVGTRN